MCKIMEGILIFLKRIHKHMIKNFGLERIGVSQPFSHYDLYKESS